MLFVILKVPFIPLLSRITLLAPTPGTIHQLIDLKHFSLPISVYSKGLTGPTETGGIVEN
jgi:hypothetical protein